ncbi:monovalent cation:H+ antiporter, CPA1 (nhx1) [Pichia californica]|uniref:Sodium/hydrogen exchanger n=1 Tax=Pichia californica TaxID=460514 RepID=A0A9P6WKR9_9ASCO|nr:monovalent cation:H+ antiporter, CPA1 (nhx1) [[Candida] californica]
MKSVIITILLNSAIVLAKKAVVSANKGSTDFDNPIDEAPIDDSPDLNIPDDNNLEDVNPVAEEIFSSWALFIVLFLLCAALWSSYYLQQRRIKAIHETVLSIFYGMVIGLIIRVSPGHYIQDAVKFNSSYFFNILLPPIILNSGYELHQANFFRNIGSILTFAIPGTFISSIVVGIILFIYTKLGFESINMSFVDSLAVGATLSATDPVTILSIFNSYKVDPKLYTIIFGESLLNDAICIVMFETCQKFHGKHAQFSSFFEGISLFLVTFTISTLIGLVMGVLIALVLKHSHIRRYPQIETCLVLLFAYESYFFSNGCHMSGIVSLLFCGITMKHYAYYNMSRRTQIATKYIFQLLAQLSENFIFIYLGLSLFTEVELVFKPLLIIVTFVCICVARWAAVFPLSKFINWFSRNRKQARGLTSLSVLQDEIPYNYQMMQFWAGLRGAVGVALAMGLQGESKSALLATVLIVVVLTVILFGGTTAGMLEMLNIKTGCIEEDVSDDEFDIEMPNQRISNNINNNNNNIGNQLNMSLNSASSSQYFDKFNKSNSRSRATSEDDAIDPSTLIEMDLPPAAVKNLTPFPKTSIELSNQNILSTSNNSSNIINNNNILNSPTRTSNNDSNSGIHLSEIFSVDEHAKWFTNFDENVLKPVLLDSLPSENNKNTNDQ